MKVNSVHKKMEVEVVWHRGNNVAERDGDGLRSWAYKPSGHRGVSTGNSGSSREDKPEEVQTSGRSTNKKGESGLKGGDKEENKDPGDTEE